MRYMSFALTTQQVLEKQKTVTRRLGWHFLKPGDELQPAMKVMGFKKGEKIQKIGGPIRIISTRLEKLGDIDKEDVIREGFKNKSPEWFVKMLKHHYVNIDEDTMVNRIEFKYI